jgi:SSS family solute:Na+ symporter
LFGGIGILQTLPALVFGRYSNWFRAPALLAGWVVGFFEGTHLVWLNGLKPLHVLSLSGSRFTVYIGIHAFTGNILVALLVNLAFRPGLKSAAA